MTASGGLTRKGFMQMYHTQTSARPHDTAADLYALDHLFGDFQAIAAELERLGDSLAGDADGDGQGADGMEGALFEELKAKGLPSDPELIRRELERLRVAGKAQAGNGQDVPPPPPPPPATAAGDICPNQKVMVQGLSGRKDLNGCVGLVLGPKDATSERWPVRVYTAGGEVEVKIKGINLEPDV
eukprot:243144-Prymnesium_polylepis.2